MANGNLINVFNIGSTTYSIGSRNLKLDHILHVLRIAKNLLSINRPYLDNDVVLQFDDSHVYVKDQRTNEMTTISDVEDGLYKLHLDDRTSNKASMNLCEKKSLETWHHRLGHICENNVRNLNIIFLFQINFFQSVKHVFFLKCIDYRLNLNMIIQLVLLLI